MKHPKKKGKNLHAAPRKGAGGHDPSHAQGNRKHGLPADCFAHGEEGYGCEGAGMAEEDNASGSNEMD